MRSFNYNNKEKSIMPTSDYDLEHRKDIFEKFLTYRRRMARMAIIMGLYMIDRSIIASAKNATMQDVLFDGQKSQTKPEIFAHSVIYIYKNYFFNKKTYGLTNKTKKLDEKFLFDVLSFASSNLDKIDENIAKNLHTKWKVENLDSLVRSILRAAIAEKLFLDKVEKAIITSEYTNLASYFFQGKEIGFINGILHAFCEQ